MLYSFPSLSPQLKLLILSVYVPTDLTKQYYIHITELRFLTQLLSRTHRTCGIFLCICRCTARRLCSLRWVQTQLTSVSVDRSRSGLRFSPPAIVPALAGSSWWDDSSASQGRRGGGGDRWWHRRGEGSLSSTSSLPHLLGCTSQHSWGKGVF